jgi:hypothetical protein
MRFPLPYVSFVAFFLAACGPEVPVTAGEPDDPLYSVDEDATGPLTFDELQINFAALDDPVPGPVRRCVKNAIERRAQELGDPASFQPEDHDYHGGNTSNAQWQAFDNRIQRNLLGQVVVTYAFFDCN